MPAKSLAQLRKLFTLEKRGELKAGTAEEFAHATPNIKKLPEHVKHYRGGEIQSMKHHSTDGERYGLSRGGKLEKHFAHGGRVENEMGESENEYDHGVGHERYEPEKADHYAHGGEVECPRCGHKFAHGGEVERGEVEDNEHAYADHNYRQLEDIEDDGHGERSAEDKHSRDFARALKLHRR